MTVALPNGRCCEKLGVPAGSRRHSMDAVSGRGLFLVAPSSADDARCQQKSHLGQYHNGTARRSPAMGVPQVWERQGRGRVRWFLKVRLVASKVRKGGGRSAMAYLACWYLASPN